MLLQRRYVPFVVLAGLLAFFSWDRLANTTLIGHTDMAKVHSTLATQTVETVEEVVLSESDEWARRGGVREGHRTGSSTVDAKLKEGVRARVSDDAKRFYGADTVPTKAQVNAYLELKKLQYTDIVYTWINGSDQEHFVRKALGRALSKPKQLLKKVLKSKKVFGEGAPGNSTMTLSAGKAKRSKAATMDILRMAFVGIINNLSTSAFAGKRDRDNDELRFSLRSVEQFLEWHQGRIIIVTPGAIPDWLSRSVLLTSRTRSREAPWLDERAETRQEAVPKRIMVVHQDAILPWRHRFTFNTNTIEPNVFRLNNLTKMFIQFNDDYFVLRNTTVSTFFNKYGGSNLFFEPELRPPIKNPIRQAYHTTATMLNQLVYKHVSNPAMGKWKGSPSRHEVQHAPFVYCRNMHRYLYHSLSARLNETALKHWSRNGNDTVVPMAHHVLSMEVPWRASSRFFQRDLSTGDVIHLDDAEACPPATAKIGKDAKVLFYRVKGTAQDLDGKLDRLIRKQSLVFMTLNDDMDLKASALTTGKANFQDFLSSRYPRPSAWELDPDRGNSDGTGKHPSSQGGLLRSGSIVVPVSDIDGVCPALRSFRIGFPEFEGTVFVVRYDRRAKLKPSLPPEQNVTEERTGIRSIFTSSVTSDEPSGRLRGLTDKEGSPLPLTQGYFVPCHLRSDRVRLVGFKRIPPRTDDEVQAPSDDELDSQDLAIVLAKAKNVAKEGELQGPVALVDKVDPVFGQTVAHEDLLPLPNSPQTVEMHHNRTCFTVGTASLNMIRSPSFLTAMSSFRLPHPFFETWIPSDD